MLWFRKLVPISILVVGWTSTLIHHCFSQRNITTKCSATPRGTLVVQYIKVIYVNIRPHIKHHVRREGGKGGGGQWWSGRYPKPLHSVKLFIRFLGYKGPIFWRGLGILVLTELVLLRLWVDAVEYFVFLHLQWSYRAKRGHWSITIIFGRRGRQNICLNPSIHP